VRHRDVRMVGSQLLLSDGQRLEVLQARDLARCPRLRVSDRR
jgi:hypothetical protein